MGKFNPVADAVFQNQPIVSRPVFSTPAYFNGTVYYVRSATRSRPSHSTTRTSRPPDQPRHHSIVLSCGYAEHFANGTNDAILWAVENGYSATLHALRCNRSVQELYNSNQAPLYKTRSAPTTNSSRLQSQWQGVRGTTYGVAVFACDS